MHTSDRSNKAKAPARAVGSHMQKLLTEKDLLAVTGGASPGPRTPPKAPPPKGGNG